MIVVDTSAITAIAFGEPERAAFSLVIQRAQKALISTVSVVQARMVVHGRLGQRAVILLDDLLRLQAAAEAAQDVLSRLDQHP